MKFDVIGLDHIYISVSNLEQSEVMYNEGVPEFVVDQNMYYPAATNYGFYCTGK